MNIFDHLKEKLRSAFTQDDTLPIEIFVRHCNYTSVSAHKNRLPNFDKERCLKNLLSTIVGHPKINITFFLDTFHPMQGMHFLHKQGIYPVIEFKGGSEAVSFLEDDYLHRPDWPVILREGFTIPGIDYVTLFDHRDKYLFPQYIDLKSKIFHTQSCHWRTTPSTTNTYAMLFQTLQKHIDFHRCFSLGRTITADHEKFCKLAEEGSVLISSIPGYSTHVEEEYASPCTDWSRFLQNEPILK
jgi:hypothetical protein